MTDEQIAVMVQASPPRDVSRPLPDFKQIHQDLKKPGVTLTLLWQEYKAGSPEGYQLSQFYQHYHAFAQTLRVTLRQTYTAGEVMFIMLPENWTMEKA